MIIVLDGPINAGKSTIGALLANRLPYTVHIEVDALRHFADCLTLAQAIPYALADAVDLAKTWTGRGFHVVASWPVERANIHHFAAAAAETGAPLYVFTLLPRLEVALIDRGQRPLTSKERARIREMYASMYAAGQAAGVVIDNSEQTPAETVQEILARIEAANNHAGARAVGDEMAGPIFTVTDRPAPADAAFIRQRIKEFNDSVSAHHRSVRPTGKEPLAALMHDGRGRLIGGLFASVYWGWLDIEELWIAEEWRGQGHGRRLMGLIEEAALERGCRQAQVKTWDFQARGFYERFGYVVTGSLDDYPPGNTLYWLRKALLDADQAT